MANNLISPELVLVDPELRASVMAEFRAAASYDLPVLDWTTPDRDSGRVAFRASSGNDEEVSRDREGQVPLVFAAAVYAAARLVRILIVGALSAAALALVTTALAWIG